MAVANVKLSKNELMLVCDEEFILTKNNIINKVYQLFGALSDHFFNCIKNAGSTLPLEVLTWSPKIYKGEQYMGLPYVMLDHPRYFVKEDAFAIRCLFWWGKFFSITLHLAGKYAFLHGRSIQDNLSKAQHSEWYVCVNKDPWHHHFDPDNYVLLNNDISGSLNEEMLAGKPFFKIAKKIPLTEWDNAADFFVSGYNEILDMLKENNVR